MPSSSDSEFISGARTRSRTCIAQRSLRAASGLRELGVQAGDAIGVLLRNDFAFIEASWAANALGVSAVAVNWHLAAPEIEFVLQDCGAKVLIAHADLLHRFAGAIADDVKVLAVETPDEIQQAYDIAPEQAALNPLYTTWETWADDYEPLRDQYTKFVDTMSYTSGTTGTPKGVRRLPQSAQSAAKLFAIRDLIYGLHEHSRAIVSGP